MASHPVKVALPPTEVHQYQQLTTHIQGKKWEKAQKTAEGILKKYPNHGESLALKGLAMHAQGSREEGYNLVRKGLRYDIASPVCWHAMATLYRQDKVWNQARKYITQALYLDKHNEKFLNDLAVVQLHLRDFHGHMQTRKTLMKTSSSKLNWIAYGLAAHLIGEHTFASKVISSYQDATIQEADAPSIERWEFQSEESELLLYKNFILRDSGDHQAALKDLLEIKDRVVDKLFWQEAHAELLLKTGNFADAISQYLTLIDINPDNIGYHVGLQQSHGISVINGSPHVYGLDNTGKQISSPISMPQSLTTEQLDTLTTLYNDLTTKYPKSSVIKQLPLLYWLEGTPFEKAFEKYAQALLSKGVPSLFESVKPLYHKQANVQIIQTSMLNWASSLEASSKWSPDSSTTEPTTTLLWVLYFLAQHYQMLEDLNSALKWIDSAIKHSPTVIDLYLVKADILGLAGDPEEATEQAEKARSMDLADRNLNTRSVPFIWRSNDTTKAQSTFALFTRLDSGHYSNVYTMQVLWYENEAGEAWARVALRNPTSDALAKSMKAFQCSIEHFKEFNEDQVDFFLYGVRNHTLSSYVRLMRTADRLDGKQALHRALKGQIKNYLRVDDETSAVRPSSISLAPLRDVNSFHYIDVSYYDYNPIAVEAATVSNDASTNKKVPPSKKKGQADSSTSTSATKTWNNKHDKDPNGQMLRSTKQPLNHIPPLLEKLLSFSFDEDLESNALAIQYYLRSKHWMLALRSLKQVFKITSSKCSASSVDGLHHSFFLLLVQFTVAWKDAQASAGSNPVLKSPSLVKSVDDQLKSWIGGDVEVTKFVEAYAAKAKSGTCFRVRLAASIALIAIGKGDAETAFKPLFYGIPHDNLPHKYPVSDLHVAKFLVKHLWSNELESFKNEMHKLYPLMAAFAPPRPAVPTPVEEPTDKQATK